jgi:hypothetical protein
MGQDWQPSAIPTRKKILIAVQNNKCSNNRCGHTAIGISTRNRNISKHYPKSIQYPPIRVHVIRLETDKLHLNNQFPAPIEIDIRNPFHLGTLCGPTHTLCS